MKTHTAYFYTTSGCHLCEEAMAMLTSLNMANKLNIEVIDIAENADLVDIYGVRIPVIKREDEQELGWPFDEIALLSFFGLD